jgi:hypothetical protein
MSVGHINGYSEMFLEDEIDCQRLAAVDYLTLIDAAGQRMLGIIDELLGESMVSLVELDLPHDQQHQTAETSLIRAAIESLVAEPDFGDDVLRSDLDHISDGRVHRADRSGLIFGCGSVWRGVRGGRFVVFDSLLDPLAKLFCRCAK